MAFASALFTELCSSPSLVIAAVLPAELLKVRNTSGRNRGNGNLEGYCSLKGVGVQKASHNLFPSQSEADAFTSMLFELCWWFQVIIWSSNYFGRCIIMDLCNHVDFLWVLVLVWVKDLHRMSHQEYNFLNGEKRELQRSKSSVKCYNSLVYSEKETCAFVLLKIFLPTPKYHHHHCPQLILILVGNNSNLEYLWEQDEPLTFVWNHSHFSWRLPMEQLKHGFIAITCPGSSHM